MSIPILTRSALIVALAAAFVVPADAVEPVDYEQAPHLRQFWPTGVDIEVVAVVGTTTFGLAGNGDLYAVDPTQAGLPSSPVLTGTGATDLHAWEDTSTLLLNVPGTGVRVVDVAQPGQPIDVQTIPVGLSAEGTGAVVDLGQGSIRYVSGGPTILFSFVLDFPGAAPMDFRTAVLPAPAHRYVGFDDHVYGATANGVLIATEAPFSSYDVGLLDNNPTEDVTIRDDGSTLVAAQGDQGTLVYDVSDPDSPQMLANLPGISLRVDIHDSDIVVADSTDVDLYRNLPVPILDFTLVAPDPNSVSLDANGTLHVGTDDGILLSDTQGDPVEPAAEYIFQLPNHLDSDPNQPGILFTVNDFVVESFDVSDPQNPASLGFLPIFDIAQFVVRAGLGMATVDGGGLHVIDLSDPNNLILLGFFGLIPGPLLDVSPGGDCAILAGGNNIGLVDLTDPSAPAARGSFSFDGPVDNVLLNDTLAVVHHTTAVTVLDITDKDNPVQLHRYEGLAGILALQRTSADDFLVQDADRISRIDPDDGQEIGGIDHPLGPGVAIEGVDEVVLKAAGETYYLLSPDGTILVLDWSDPAAPRFVGEITTATLAPQEATITGNLLVLAEAIGPGQLSLYPAHGTTATAAPGVWAPPSRLRSLYPNPTDGATQVLLDLSRATSVSLAVYDLRGRRVRTVTSGTLPAGVTRLRWDGRDQRGRSVAAGRYVLRVESAGWAESRPVTVVR